MNKQVRWWILAGCMTAGSAVASATPPQAPGVAPSHPATTEQVLLNKPVSLDVQRTPLIEALQMLQRQSGLKLIYSDDDLAGKRVTATVRDLLPIDALRVILQGTGLSMRTGADGRVAIWKDDAAKPAAKSQDTIPGVIRGRVIDVSNQRPIALVTVSISGFNRSAITNANGTYLLPSVRPGKHIISARLLGYAVSEKSVTVTSGDTVTVDFTLTAVPGRLREVVTTGAGDRERVEVGNSIGTLNVDSIVQNTPIQDLSDLIRSRIPGAQVLASGGTVGSGARVRIRGIASVLMNSDPIVIVDGVRLDAMHSQIPTGNANTNFSTSNNQLNNRVNATSRLNDIDPEMIESIDVLKGPSASTLYGSDAANGVIVIKTKRGRPGMSRWAFSTNQAMSTMKAKFADAWTAWGTSPTAPTLGNCTLAMLAELQCTQDSVTHYNPLNAKESSPFGTGRNSSYNVQVSGGSNQIQYFLGTTYTNDRGMLKLPASEAARLREIRNGAPLPEWTTNPNILKGTNVTANLTTQVSPKLDFMLNGSFLSQYHRDAGQGATGYVSESYTTLGYRDSIGQGWGTKGPGANFLQRNSDAVKRLNGGITANARPSTWLSMNAVVGLDYTARHDDILLRATDLLGTGTTSLGANLQSTRGRDDSENTGRTANVTGTLNLPLSSGTRLRSSLGGQYNRTDNNGLSVTGTGLPVGSDVITNASSPGVPQERRSATATAGWFFDEGFAFRDRMFVNIAMRGDAGSAFGRQAKPMLYPKFNTSWLLSQEDFFPKTPAVTNLRIRAAFGQAGVQPSVDARFRSYNAFPAYPEGTVVPGIQILSVGNSNLVPERSVEFEGGFDLGLWDDRVTLDLTNYYKFTKNALISRTLPPSLGITARQENVGEVENRGLEISATARPVMNSLLDWSITLGFSRNSNKLVKLGTDSMATSYSAQSRFVEGYPINGYWGRPIVAYADIDGNGLLSPSEVQIADSSVYVGQQIPKGELSMHTTLAMLSGRLSVSSGFSYQNGLTQYNQALQSQCSSGRCRLTTDPTVSLRDQAIAMSMSGSINTPYGGYEQVSWLRWNDLSVTMMAPPSLTRALRGKTASLSLMGRNLWLWSKYRGADPEVNSTNTGNHTRDIGAVPQTRDWSLRVNLNY